MGSSKGHAPKTPRRVLIELTALAIVLTLIVVVAILYFRGHLHIIHWIHTGGYPALFAILFSCGLGLPLPEDVPLTTAGALIQTGHFKLFPAAVCAWCGIIGGDCVLYWMSRKLGQDIVNVPIIGRHINRKRIAQMEKWFERWGIWVVGICRMFAVVRGAMVVVAGTSKYNFWKFLIADGIAAIFSGGLFVLIGYKLAENGERLKKMSENIKGGMLIGGVTLAVVIAVIIWWKRRASRARKSIEESAPAEPQASPSSPGDPA